VVEETINESGLMVEIWGEDKKQETRDKSQEPRVKNQEPRSKSQETRDKSLEFGVNAIKLRKIGRSV
jgi:hypothetical protein